MNELLGTITKGIQEKKGKSIVIANLTNIGDTICDYFVICQGNSPSQIQAITESIYKTVHKETFEKPTNVCGLENCQWVAMDYSNIIVHIFLPEHRKFYDLEHLWEDAQLTTLSDID